MFLEPNYKSWPRHFTTIGQLALEKGTEVIFNAIGSGIFICKEPRNLLEAVSYTIDNRIEEGFNLNQLDITQAMDKAYQTVNKFGCANKSNISIEEPVSSGSVNNVLSDNEFYEEMNDNNNIITNNYCSSPEETPPNPKKTKKHDVENDICRSCCQFVDRTKQVTFGSLKHHIINCSDNFSEAILHLFH